MQRDCALRRACRGRLTAFVVEYETGDQSLLECAESFTKEELRQLLQRLPSRHRGPCVFSNDTKEPGGRTFVIAAHITCAALEAHTSTPPFEVVPHTRKLDCSGMEPGRL
ncbi:hypothetical protein TNCV_4700721 [Trichonephila clavipes]|nr:hypothetical protein TNCV_4700721 [Trichonephila clavipes]